MLRTYRISSEAHDNYRCSLQKWRAFSCVRRCGSFSNSDWALLQQSNRTLKSSFLQLLTFMVPCIINARILSSTTNKIQRHKYSLLLSMLYMFQAGSPLIIRSSKTMHTASGICQACLLLPLAVAASKLGIYSKLCVQFLSSWWWAENPPETCRALTTIKNIINRCILLVILKRVHFCNIFQENTNTLSAPNCTYSNANCWNRARKWVSSRQMSMRHVLLLIRQVNHHNR